MKKPLPEPQFFNLKIECFQTSDKDRLPLIQIYNKEKFEYSFIPDLYEVDFLKFPAEGMQVSSDITKEQEEDLKEMCGKISESILKYLRKRIVK